MSQSLTPARVTPPGRILVRELEARGWTQKDLAQITGRPEQAISEIVRGTKQITPETALALADAFGTSAEFWTNLEANYRLWLAKRAKLAQGDEAVARKSRLYSLAPVSEMIKRGWIKAVASASDLEAEFCRFFGVASPDEAPALAVSFRHSVERGPELGAEIAWAKRVEQIARSQAVGQFEPQRLRAALPGLMSYAKRAEDAARVPPAVLGHGVHFAVVRHLPKTYLDGAAMHLDGRPVVALTLRYDRLDHFWFTLLHELAHIVAGHEGAYLDRLYGVERTTADECEDQANSMAGDWLLEADAYERFLRTVGRRTSRSRVEQFAREQGRHPSIVVGRLQHDRHIGFSSLRDLLVPVRQYLEPWVDKP